MKRLIQLVIVSSSLSFSNAFAGTPVEDKVKNNFSYNSPDDAVKFSVERSKGEVKLQVDMKDMKGYDRVIIERSSSPVENFTVVKSISCADHLKYSKGNPIMQADKCTNSNDVFYRVKTVTTDGIERLYAPLQVSVAKK